MLPGLGFVLHRRTRRLRLALALVVAVICFLNILHAWHAQSTAYRRNLNPPPLPTQNIFIASLHWNSEAVLRAAWSESLLSLIDSLGSGASSKTNIFVSIYESGSWDGTKGLLQELDGNLGERNVPRRVILDNTTHADEMKSTDPHGWVTDSNGKRHRRRIPYLAGLRNMVLEPLREQKTKGVVYDKVLFIEDIIFSANDARSLLATRGGDYAAACALDASKAPLLYDTFALRGSEGHEPLSIRWPYFRSTKSREATIKGEPVPVRSCWNGMVAMDAAPFYDGLKFRGLSDSLAASHLEGSECCLIHTDNKASPQKGVWMNTNVRIGYNVEAYAGVHPFNRPYLSTFDIGYGLWSNRLSRWSSTTWFKERVVNARVTTWENENATNREPGRDCVVNEMQILVENGWAHV